MNKLRLIGGGPAFEKIGRRVVYSRESLDAWRTARRVGSTSEYASPAASPDQATERSELPVLSVNDGLRPVARVMGHAAGPFQVELADGQQLGAFPTLKMARKAISDSLRNTNKEVLAD